MIRVDPNVLNTYTTLLVVVGGGCWWANANLNVKAIKLHQPRENLIYPFKNNILVTSVGFLSTKHPCRDGYYALSQYVLAKYI